MLGGEIVQLDPGLARFKWVVPIPSKKEYFLEKMSQIGDFADNYIRDDGEIVYRAEEVAQQARTEVMGEFLNLKAELVRTQQRNDDLRSENHALRESLNATEHMAQNLLTYVNDNA